MLRLRIIWLLTIGLVTALLTGRAQAASLSIEPIRQELSLAPGQTLSTQLRVINNSKQTISVTLSAQDFRVVNEEYDYAFADSEDLSRWVKLPADALTLAAGDSKNVPYTLTVPLGTEPGSRYIAIFAAATTASTNGIATVERAGSLLYITIPGDVTHKGELLGLTLPWFSLKPTLAWNLRIKNSGNNHFHSLIVSQVDGLFGGKVTSSSISRLILPSTIRSIDGTAKLGRWPGLYRVKLDIGLGDSGAASYGKVLYLPPIAIAVMVAVLAGIVVILLKHRSLISLGHGRIDHGG